MSGKPPMPARGAVAGIKADLARAKESGKYDPRGVGNAFTHNFLNQKPWHPMNFRNQITKYEAEQKQIQEQKAKEAGQAEFEAEQESMRTLSYLSEAEQQRYRDRQSISFMYTKPPGLEAALAKEAAAVKPSEGAVAAPGAAAGPSGGNGVKGGRQPLTPEQLQQQEMAAAHAKELDRLREDPFAVMLTARMNLKNNDRFIIKHGGAGDAPAHGGYRKDAQNQRLLDAPPDQGPGHTHQEVAPGVVADAEDLAVLESMPEHERSAVLKRLRKMQRQAEKELQLEQAHAVLRSAGYDLAALQQQAESVKHSKKAKHKSKEKSKKKRRRKDDAGRQHRSSGSSSSDG